MADLESRLKPEILPHTRGCFDFIKSKALYQKEVPYQVIGYLPPDQEIKRTNVEWEPHEVDIYDLRGNLEALSVEANGFEFVRLPELGQADLSSETGLKDYFLKAAEFLKVRFNTETVMIWNYNYRGPEASYGVLETPSTYVAQVHTDGTKEGGPRRIRKHLTKEEADMYFDGSWHLRQVTVWRPTKVVADNPLALCDPATVLPSDLIATSRVTPEFAGEVNFLKYNNQQRFYYLSQQKPDEVLLFLGYDSGNGYNKLVPHASFSPLGVDLPADTKSRESFDFRATIITKKDSDQMN